jgi:hypothetical protein
MLVVLTGSACSHDGFDEAKYCAAIPLTVNGAVDSHGKPLAEFGPRDQQRSYKRLAKLGPTESRTDWELVGELVSSGQPPERLGKAFDAEDRLKISVEQTCGLDLDVSARRSVTVS